MVCYFILAIRAVAGTNGSESPKIILGCGLIGMTVNRI